MRARSHGCYPCAHGWPAYYPCAHGLRARIVNYTCVCYNSSCSLWRKTTLSGVLGLAALRCHKLVCSALPPLRAPLRMSISQSAAESIRSECFADDIPLPTNFAAWSPSELTEYFESGGDITVGPPVPLRFLCLHGGGVNIDVMKYQLRKLQVALGGSVTCEFLGGARPWTDEPDPMLARMPAPRAVQQPNPVGKPGWDHVEWAQSEAWGGAKPATAPLSGQVQGALLRLVWRGERWRSAEAVPRKGSCPFHNARLSI